MQTGESSSRNCEATDPLAFARASEILLRRAGNLSVDVRTAPGAHLGIRRMARRRDLDRAVNRGMRGTSGALRAPAASCRWLREHGKAYLRCAVSANRVAGLLSVKDFRGLTRHL